MAGDAKTDHLVQYFVRLQQIAEDVNSAFDYDIDYAPSLDAVRVELLSKTFTQQLSQINMTFPASAWENGKLI